VREINSATSFSRAQYETKTTCSWVDIDIVHIQIVSRR